MVLITDVAHWEGLADVDPEYEMREEKIQAQFIRRNDRIDGAKVSKITAGTKWVDVRDAADKRIIRVELGELVTVSRRYQTQASAKYLSRADQNVRLAKILAEDVDEVTEVLERMKRKLDDWGYIDYGPICDLIETQARVRVMKSFTQAVEYLAKNDDWEGDLVDALDEFRAELVKNLSSRHRNRALSRSSNMISNLMEDAEREAEAKFADWLYWRL